MTLFLFRFLVAAAERPSIGLVLSCRHVEALMVPGRIVLPDHRGRVSCVKIIAVTSYALSGEEKKAREAGCDDYVPAFQPTSAIGENSTILVLNSA